MFSNYSTRPQVPTADERPRYCRISTVAGELSWTEVRDPAKRILDRRLDGHPISRAEFEQILDDHLTDQDIWGAA